MYYNDEVNFGEWFVERCKYCDSINHIFVNIPDAHAWECYCCFNRCWIDDMAREQYVLDEGLYEADAEEHLQSNSSNIRFLHGQTEQY